MTMMMVLVIIGFVKMGEDVDGHDGYDDDDGDDDDDGGDDGSDGDDEW